MPQENIKNYGFLPDKEQKDRQDTDWIFGATSLHCLSEGLPLEKYLPAGEVQRGVEDMMDCATRAPINIAETKFSALVKNKIFSEENIKWLKDKGYSDEEGNVTFSDAFIAIKSGTTRSGNSLKAPVDAIHRFGLIPKKILPLEKWMSWSNYHNPQRITKEMVALGLEFLAKFPINYDIVYGGNYIDFIRKDELLDTAGYAWPEPVNGIYPRVNYPYNHAFVIFPPAQWKVFDNYIDFDNDFIKTLAPNYDLLGYAYRLIINEVRPQPEAPEVKKNSMTFVKNNGTPDIYVKGLGDQRYHRIADENTFVKLFGAFSENIITEIAVPEEQIAEPLYLTSSLTTLIINFFKNLKGKV